MAGMTSTGHQTAELNAARARIMDLERHVADLVRANRSMANQILALLERAFPSLAEPAPEHEPQPTVFD